MNLKSLKISKNHFLSSIGAVQSLNVVTIHSKPTTDVAKLIVFAPPGQHHTGLLVEKIFKQRLTTPLTTDLRRKKIFRINTGNKQKPVTETQAAAILTPGGTFHMCHH